MGTNFESVYHLTQLAHPLLKESGQGSIVSISSIAGLKALPVFSVYAASKGAMNQFTKNLALEWAKDNIRANAVAPGPVMTKLLDSIMNSSGGDESVDGIVSQTLVGRMGEAKEISALVAFLCLPAASYITGQSSNVQRRFTFTTSPSTGPSPSLCYCLPSPSLSPHFLPSSSSFRLHSIKAFYQNNPACHTPSPPNPNLVHHYRCLLLHVLPPHNPSFFASHQNTWLVDEKLLRHQIDTTTEEIVRLHGHIVELDDGGKTFLGTVIDNDRGVIGAGDESHEFLDMAASGAVLGT
ncbi:hypothetical protein JHK87_018357 [Glycine soja]|nr:hypothetical protein JHK87_018357 [Glycine soja]